MPKLLSFQKIILVLQKKFFFNAKDNSGLLKSPKLTCFSTLAQAQTVLQHKVTQRIATKDPGRRNMELLHVASMHACSFFMEPKNFRQHASKNRAAHPCNKESFLQEKK